MINSCNRRIFHLCSYNLEFAPDLKKKKIDNEKTIIILRSGRKFNFFIKIVYSYLNYIVFI